MQAAQARFGRSRATLVHMRDETGVILCSRPRGYVISDRFAVGGRGCIGHSRSFTAIPYSINHILHLKVSEYGMGGTREAAIRPLKIHHRAPIPEVTRDWGSERIWGGSQRHTRRGGRVCTPPASRRSGAETDTREGEPRTVRHRAIGLGVRRESGVRSATAARGERGHTHQSACRCVRQRWTHSAKIGN